MLADRHLAFLAARAVTGPVVERRGYATITDWADLAAAGFPERQARILVPGLLIPRFGLGGRRSWPKFRPDPEAHNGGGPKYSSPALSWNFLDALPGTDLRGDLWVSAEGFVKSDSMTAAGVTAVAVDGVYGWRSGGETVPGLETLARPGRWFSIVCDSDIDTNPRVASAMFRLAATLRREGAKVRILHPPTLGPKAGVDDYLAGGGSLDELVVVGRPTLCVRRAWAGRRLALGWGMR